MDPSTDSDVQQALEVLRRAAGNDRATAALSVLETELRAGTPAEKKNENPKRFPFRKRVGENLADATSARDAHSPPRARGNVTAQKGA